MLSRETTRKCKMAILANRSDMTSFCQNGHFGAHFDAHFASHFAKMKSTRTIKMRSKWLQNGYSEQP